MNLKGKHILFVGDSVTRFWYLDFAFFLVTGRYPQDGESRDKLICFELGFESWNEYYADTNGKLSGHEICDCYREESPMGWSKEGTFTENRFTRIPTRGGGSIQLSYATNMLNHNWQMHGHVTPGGFGFMQDHLACGVGNCSGSPTWTTNLTGFFREVVPSLGVTHLVINFGLHWTPAQAPEEAMEEVFAAAAASAEHVYYRTTAMVKSRKPTGMNGGPIRDPVAVALALKHGMVLLDYGALTTLNMSNAVALNPKFGSNMPKLFFMDRLHFSCSVYREFSRVLLGAVCFPPRTLGQNPIEADELAGTIKKVGANVSNGKTARPISQSSTLALLPR